MAELQSIFLHFRKVQPQAILNVQRADGTSTWTRLYPGMALHDLAHYVIETTLQLKDAFYGILALGHNIEDFAAPSDQRPSELLPKNLPVASLQTEHLVNLLLTELQSGRQDNFLELFNTVLASADLPPMEQLTQEKLETIRAGLSAIRRTWIALDYGETLVLEMDFR